MAKKELKKDHPCQCGGECMCGGTCKEEVTAEAVVQKIAQLADLLDAGGYHKEAMAYDEIMVKIAQHQMQPDYEQESDKPWKGKYRQDEETGQCFNCHKPMELFDDSGEMALSDVMGNTYCGEDCQNEAKRHVPQWFTDDYDDF